MPFVNNNQRGFVKSGNEISNAVPNRHSLAMSAQIDESFKRLGQTKNINGHADNKITSL